MARVKSCVSALNSGSSPEEMDTFPEVRLACVPAMTQLELVRTRRTCDCVKNSGNYGGSSPVPFVTLVLVLLLDVSKGCELQVEELGSEISCIFLPCTGLGLQLVLPRKW